MKISIITNTSGGLFLFRHELLSSILQSNTVDVMTSDTGKIHELEQLGCRINKISMDRRGKNPIHEVRLILSYFQFLNSKRPDLTITYTIKPNIYGGILCRLMGFPYASNITGLGTAFEKTGALKRLIVFLYKLSLKNAKTVFFENSDNLKFFLEKKIIRSDQACLLSGAGVNLKHFYLQPYPSEEPIRFLFMGRIMKEKGVDELFYAMKMLVANGYNCKLDMIGGLEEQYQQAIDSYTKEGWLCYYGFQQDVRPFIKKSHCFVLPSWHEGMANTVLECASSGRPVITSNIPGCKEAVDENSGILCTPKDADSLYNAMIRMVNLSNDERRNMGIRGRARMEELFDKDDVVKKTIKYLGI